MGIISQIIIAAFIAMFVENTIFAKALGTSTLLLAAKNKVQFIGFGISITYITTVSSAIAYFVDNIFLDKESSYLYMPIIYVFIIGVVYILTLILLWRFAYRIFILMKRFVHISSFNCAVLGALFFNSKSSDSFIGYLVYGLGTGIGFMIATYLLSIVYDRLYSSDVPESFRGYPLILIYIGILSMAFYGLIGHQFNL